MRLCTLPKSRVPTSLLCTHLLQIHLLSLAASYAEEQRRTLLVLEKDKWCVDTDAWPNLYKITKHDDVRAHANGKVVYGRI